LNQYKTWAFACTNVIAETLANQDHHLLNKKEGKPIVNPLYDLIDTEFLQTTSAFLKLA